ncbi:hypothetical protein JYT31_03095, partial [Beggiatoa alba]|nr:hypothetical protein [Beggiatoa alba]
LKSVHINKQAIAEKIVDLALPLYSVDSLLDGLTLSTINADIRVLRGYLMPNKHEQSGVHAQNKAQESFNLLTRFWRSKPTLNLFVKVKSKGEPIKLKRAILGVKG